MSICFKIVIRVSLRQNEDVEWTFIIHKYLVDYKYIKHSHIKISGVYGHIDIERSKSDIEIVLLRRHSNTVIRFVKILFKISKTFFFKTVVWFKCPTYRE